MTAQTIDSSAIDHIFSDKIAPTLPKPNSELGKTAVIIASVCGAGKTALIESDGIENAEFRSMLKVLGHPLSIDAWRQFYPDFEAIVKGDIFSWSERKDIGSAVRQWRRMAMQHLPRQEAPIFLETGPLSDAAPVINDVYGAMIDRRYNAIFIAVAASNVDCRAGVISRFAHEIVKYDPDQPLCWQSDTANLPPRWLPDPGEIVQNNFADHVRALWDHCAKILVINPKGALLASKADHSYEVVRDAIINQPISENAGPRLTEALSILENYKNRYPKIEPAYQECRKLSAQTNG